MTAIAEPLTVVDVGVQTLAELGAPCDEPDHDAPARWIVRWRIACEHVQPLHLICDPCAEYVRSNGTDWNCWECAAEARLTSLEALR